jgi:hypothetical protein
MTSTPGIHIVGASDAAHAVHTDDSSQSSLCVSVGTNCTPFLIHACAERSCVSPDATGAEHIALGRCAKDVIFSTVCSSIGIPSKLPIFVDNKSAINLTLAPEVTRKSRHHYIRDLVPRHLVLPTHKGTHDLLPDVTTKHHGPVSFLYFRSKLMGTKPAALSTLILNFPTRITVIFFQSDSSFYRL